MSATSKAAAVLRFEPDEQPPPRKRELGKPSGPGTTLEQKYTSLAEAPRAVLRCLSIFAGEFTFEAACAVATCDRLQKHDVAPSIAALVESSLLEGGDEGAFARYHLTRQIRVYALTQLFLDDELDLAARRHAEYLQHLFEYAEVELDRGEVSQWLASYGRLVDDVRAALDWAFSPSGDASIGVGLTVAALPLWVLCSRPDELCCRIERALNSEAGAVHSPREMQLRVAARLAGMSGLLK